ncbi:MAG: cytochrome c biogenesis protein [Pseudomonadota bacterium]
MNRSAIGSLVFSMLALMTAVAMLAAPYLIVAKAPLAYELFINQKIFYYHVPAAWAMLLSVLVCGSASIGYLVGRADWWDDVAAAAGRLAVVFGLIVLTTGPIWAKAAWGVYWTWEARLTTMLVLWLTFVAYCFLRRHGDSRTERLAAGLAVFGMADAPLVYFAVSFWRTQHPGNWVVPSLPSSMLVPFLVSMGAFSLLWAMLLATLVAVRSGERRLRRLAFRLGQPDPLEQS